MSTAPPKDCRGVLIAHGADALREMVLNAVPFVPAAKNPTKAPTKKPDPANFVYAAPGTPPADAAPELSSGEAPVTAPASNEENIRTVLAERAFNFALAPIPPYPILKLCDRIISTPGNLTGVQAGAKAGKTAMIGAILAAVLNGNRQGPDTLGFSAENIDAKAVLHFDTEQSRYDHDALIRRAMKRAQVNEPPAWLLSYCLTDLPIGERRDAVEVAIRDAAADHGGIFLIVIDGVADLCVDPNDPAESFGLVGRLHTLAIEHDCAIVVVLHENPGSMDGKMRGHLGSQLERKAETPLRLSKDAATGISTVWSDRARHCHLPREQGMCFQWSDTAGMHVSCGTAREIKASARQEKFRDEAEGAFGDADKLSYSDLVARITETVGVVPKTAEKRVKTYVADGLVLKSTEGIYSLKS